MTKTTKYGNFERERESVEAGFSSLTQNLVRAGATVRQGKVKLGRS